MCKQHKQRQCFGQCNNDTNYCCGRHKSTTFRGIWINVYTLNAIRFSFVGYNVGPIRSDWRDDTWSTHPGSCIILAFTCTVGLRCVLMPFGELCSHESSSPMPAKPLHPRLYLLWAPGKLAHHMLTSGRPLCAEPTCQSHLIIVLILWKCHGCLSNRWIRRCDVFTCMAATLMFGPMVSNAERHTWIYVRVWWWTGNGHGQRVKFFKYYCVELCYALHHMKFAANLLVEAFCRSRKWRERKMILTIAHKLGRAGATWRHKHSLSDIADTNMYISTSVPRPSLLNAHNTQN